MKPEHIEGPCEDESCQQCCPHDFDPEEGFMCLNCGAEGAEHVMSSIADSYGDD